MAGETEDVQLPDGRVLRGVPKGATMQQIVTELKAQGEDTSKLEAGWGPVGLLKDLSRGFVKGGAGALDLLTMGPRFSEWQRQRAAAPEGAVPSFDAFPQTAKTGAAAESLLPAEPTTSTARQYARAGLEGVGGGFAIPGPSAAITAGAGASGGLAAEGAARAFGDNPVVRGLAGLLGGAAGGTAAKFATQAKPNRVTLAQETLEGTDPANLAVAVERMRAAQAAGIPITASQAMLAPSNIDDMQHFLANSRQGDVTIKTLREQPGKLNRVAMVGLTGLPGRITSPQDVANRAQEAATAALRQGQTKANAAFKAKIPEGAEVNPARIDAFAQSLDNFVASNPANKSVAALAADVKSRLVREPGVPAIPGEVVPIGGGKVTAGLTRQLPDTPAIPATPLTNAQQLKNAIDDAIQSFGANTQNTSADRKDLNRYAQTIRTLFDRTVATPGSPLREARAAARDVYVNEVNPLRKGVVGRVAGVAGATDVKEAARGQLEAVLQRGTPSGQFSEIRELAATLNKQDPTVFPDLVKTHIADKLDKLLTTKNVRHSQTLGRDLRDTLVGTLAKSKGIDEMLAEVAKAQKRPPEEVARGFKNLLEMLAYTDRMPNSISGLPVRNLLEIAGESRTASLLEGASSLGRLGHKIRSNLASDAYKFMDQALTSPEGLEMLSVLAKRGPKHTLSLRAVQGVFGGEATNVPPITTE